MSTPPSRRLSESKTGDTLSVADLLADAAATATEVAIEAREWLTVRGPPSVMP
jgi:hypothetical protein